MRNLYRETIGAYTAASLDYQECPPRLGSILVHLDGKLVGMLMPFELEQWMETVIYAPRAWEDCEIRHDLVLYCFDDVDPDPCIVLRRGSINGVEGWLAEAVACLQDEETPPITLQLRSAQYLPKECA
jgi:hypothetical protein